MREVLTFGLAAMVAGMISANAGAADEAGKSEYMALCATCHGESGQGDGPFAELLTVPVPDLTTIAARNDGAFPMLDVIQIIDGRTGVRGHGTSMPLWGSRFSTQIGESAGPYGAELLVRGRILSLAYYLESIQQ